MEGVSPFTVASSEVDISWNQTSTRDTMTESNPTSSGPLLVNGTVYAGQFHLNSMKLNSSVESVLNAILSIIGERNRTHLDEEVDVDEFIHKGSYILTSSVLVGVVIVIMLILCKVYHTHKIGYRKFKGKLRHRRHSDILDYIYRPAAPSVAENLDYENTSFVHISVPLLQDISHL